MTTPSILGSFTTNSSTDDPSFSHTQNAGSNRICLVGIATYDAFGGGDTTAVTYGGNSMAQAVRASVVVSATLRADFWYLLEANLPGDGANTVAATITGTFAEVVTCAFHIENAVQSAPEATNTATSASSTTTYSGSITTITDEALVINCVQHGSLTTATPGSGMTERWDVASPLNAQASGNTRVTTTAGSYNMNGTFSAATAGYANAMIAIAGVAAAAGGALFFGMGP